MKEVRLEKFDPSVHGFLIEELTTLLHSSYAPLAEKGMRYWASYQTPAETLQRLNNGESYLAFYGPQLAGTINLRGPKPDNRAAWYRRDGIYSFHQFAVSPDFQGRGLGSKMLDKVEGRANELKGLEIALDISEHADHLISSYERRGYRFIEYVQWPDVNYRSVIMSKVLRSGEKG